MLHIQPIYDKIFEYLAQRRDFTVQQLYEVVKDDNNISLSQFYKIIDQLLSKQVLVKEDGKISLHTTWILSLLSFTEQVKETYLNKPITTIDLKEGEQKIYGAQSLEALDVIWANLYSLLCIMYPEEQPYIYHAHPYYILGMYETEIANFKDLGKRNGYYLTGNTTPLDNYGIGLMKKLGAAAYASNKVSFLREGFCINIVGDYIIEVLFPDILTHYFAHFFATIDEPQKFRKDLFHNIFTINVPCKCTIRRSKKQADVWKKEWKRLCK